MSNARDLRKKFAHIVEDEIFTIQNEIDNTQKIIATVDFKMLRSLSYDRLKNIRGELQLIKIIVDRINKQLGSIGNPLNISVVIETENQKVFVEKFRNEKLLEQ